MSFQLNFSHYHQYEYSESLIPLWRGELGRMNFPAFRVAVREASILHELVHVTFPNANRMLAETHIAATPGIDFDPIRGKDFIRFCYAGATTEMHEAVARIGR